MNWVKFILPALLSTALLLLASCGEHGFFDEIFGEVSSSSESLSGGTQSSSSGGNGALPSSSSAGDECVEEICKNEEEIIDVVPPDNDVVVPPETPNSNAVVGPLLQTQWKGESPYNDMTPLQSNNISHSPAGCGAIATSQIMKYHNHPKFGTGQSEPYIAQLGGITVPSVNFGATYYDWDNMLNSYTNDNPGTEQQRNAVAQLMYHVGVASKMNYGSVETGSSTGVTYISTGLTTYLGYDKSIKVLNIIHYDKVMWEGMIKSQLDAGLPIIYMNIRHIFIVDGYDNTGKFHINWGHGGSGGWYFLDKLELVASRYGEDHRVLIDIKPDEGNVGSHEMALNDFTVNKTSVLQNELITVSAKIRSAGFFLGGQAGVALVDNTGKIITVAGIINFNAINPGYQHTLTINSFFPETVSPGQYNLRMVTRTEGGEWKIVELSDRSNNTPHSIPITLTPAEKGAPGGGYGLALTSFTTSKTAVSQSELINGIATNRTIVSQNELFTVSSALRNVAQDTFPGGQIGTALMDNNGNIKAIIGSKTFYARNPNTTSSAGDAYSHVPSSIAPGQYKLRIAVKPTDSEEWRIATMSIGETPNSIPITVTAGEANGGGYGLVLEKFESEKNSVSQNEAFTVTAIMRNRNLDAFPSGSLGVALVDNNGNIKEVIKTTNYSALSSGSSRTSTISNCTVPNTVPSGRYKLRMVVKPADGEWRIATLALPDVPNSIDFEVR